MLKGYSSVIAGVCESGTVAISDRARQMQQEGIDVINLGGGDPDFCTPDSIRAAAIEAIQKGFTHYVASKGIPELRKAIAQKYREESGLSYDANNEIIATASGKAALYIALETLVDPGDEVLYFDPAWVSYKPIIQIVKGTPVAVPLSYKDNYTMTVELIEKHVTEKTKAVIVNSPNNPTGRVLTHAELDALRQVAVKHDLWIVSDDIYEKIMYDGHQHINVASLEGMKERTIVVNGMSKAYAMTGWRLGYLTGPENIMKQILKVQQHFVTCAASFTQVAGTVAMQGDQKCVADMVCEYDRRRKWMTEALNQIPAITCQIPEGAFYLFPRVEYKNMTSYQLTEYLLETAHVAVTPGTAFGKAGEGHIRLTYATSMENLQKAAARIKSALAK